MPLVTLLFFIAISYVYMSSCQVIVAWKMPCKCENDWNNIVQRVKTLLVSKDENDATIFPICIEH